MANKSLRAATRLRLSLLAQALVLAGVAQPALAADWTITPNLTASERYTDNVNLAPSGSPNKKSDFITEIRPGVSIYKNGRRLKVNINYSLQSLTYLNTTQNNALNHQLNGVANAELLEDFLYLDLRSAIYQQNINALAPIGLGNTNATNNLSTVGTYSISPYIRKRFGTFADLNYRLSQSGVYYDTQGINNSTVQNVLGSLNSGSRFNDVFWGLDYSYTKNKNTITPDTEFEKGSATLGYALTPKFKVHATGGIERNNFISLGNSKVDGPFWNVGFDWAPTIRTQIGATVGQRFFGNTYSFNLTERTRRTTWNARYSEDITTTSGNIATAGLVGVYYACITPPQGTVPVATTSNGLFVVLIPVGTQPATQYGCQVTNLGAIGINLSLVNDVFVAKNLTAGMSYSLGRSIFSLNGFNLRRDFQQGGSYDRQTGVFAGWNWRLTPLASFNLNGNVTRIDVATSNQTNNFWALSAGLNRQFQPKLNGSVIVRHQVQTTNRPGSGYTENSITALINMSF
jgi:uncharacterized protein (PEP-CTERM system associated)